MIVHTLSTIAESRQFPFARIDGMKLCALRIFLLAYWRPLSECWIFPSLDCRIAMALCKARIARAFFIRSRASQPTLRRDTDRQQWPDTANPPWSR